MRSLATAIGQIAFGLLLTDVMDKLSLGLASVKMVRAHGRPW